MISSNTILEALSAPVRAVGARVELRDSSTLDLLDQFNDTDKLISYSIERVGASNKFFGFGICQKANVKLIDTNRELNITTSNTLDIRPSCGGNSTYTYPYFQVTEVHRDETTNELSITAYDRLYKAANYTVSDLDLSEQYTMRDIIITCAAKLGLSLTGVEGDVDSTLENGANFDGSETIREVFDAIAEATQTIYFVNYNAYLVFKRLDVSGNAVFTIGKDKYFELDSGTNRRLSGITHATELGDNVSASLEMSGTTQYVRDNPFWELREDVADLVNSALAAIGGLTINQFSCSWRGNFLLQPGDKIALITKDDETVYSYVLDDTITYDGSLSQETQWSYEDDEGEDADNPASLGDVLKQTYARVDKANKQIELVASDVSENKEVIAALKINTESIDATVTGFQQGITTAIDGITEELATLTSQVETKMSAEDVTIAIKSELSNGVDKVTTATGFTFNEDGLTISKSDSEITTTITEDGMTVYKNDEAVLVADNEGVKAEDLHATTYLIIGTYSRFEDYDNGRTGCFWIGG